MSKGPGIVTRKLSEVFRKNPEGQHTTAELCRRVYGIRRAQKKHRVAVLRALKRLGTTSMPFLWRWVPSYEKADDVWFDHRIYPMKKGCAPASAKRPRVR